MRSFEVREKPYTRSFGTNKSWIPIVVNSKTGPVSCRVRTNDGQLLCRHLDQLRKQYQAEPNQKDETDLDDWPMWSRPRQPIPLQPAPLRRSTRTRQPGGRDIEFSLRLLLILILVIYFMSI